MKLLPLTIAFASSFVAVVAAADPPAPPPDPGEGVSSAVSSAARLTRQRLDAARQRNDQKAAGCLDPVLHQITALGRRVQQIRAELETAKGDERGRLLGALQRLDQRRASIGVQAAICVGYAAGPGATGGTTGVRMSVDPAIAPVEPAIRPVEPGHSVARPRDAAAP